MTDSEKLAAIRNLIEGEPSKPIVAVVTLLIIMADDKGQVRAVQHEIGKMLHYTPRQICVILKQAKERSYVKILAINKEIGNLYQVSL